MNSQYPIGEYIYQEKLSNEERKKCLGIMQAFPQWLDIIIQNKDAIDFLKTYRVNGWNAAQVIHHCADSHMNCLIRLKLALSEENPTIKPYDEAAWAEMIDYDLPVNNSIVLLHAVHRKIVSIFDNLDEAQRSKTYYHPEMKQTFTIDALLGLYAWHCKHHFAHLELAWS
jgi:DinB superfamily